MFELVKSIFVSSSGLRVQGERMRVIAENIANSNSLPQRPGDLPYQRKVVTFRSQLDRSLDVATVQIGQRTVDRSDFGRRYDPGHPGADADGYIQLPNINGLVEAMDMKEAQRSYEANLSLIETAKSMLTRTIDILRA